MIEKCVQKDKNTILSYIALDYSSCLYLYLNLIKYGIESNTVDVFIQHEDDDISAVLLKYYSCLHVYSKGNSFDAGELADFFSSNEFTMLYCTKQTADKIYAFLPQKIMHRASITYGWVAKIEKIDKKPRGLAIPAKEKDFDQIVKLIYDDEDISRSYKYDELAKQLKERNKEGYTRNLVIKQEDLVVAHACTNAEITDIAVVAELLVRKEFRRKGYATEIWRTICSQLLSEEKEVYSFYYSKESRTLHKKIGFYEVCEWAKVVIS